MHGAESIQYSYVEPGEFAMLNEYGLMDETL